MSEKMTDLVWRKEPPDQPGLYWQRFVPSGTPKIREVYPDGPDVLVFDSVIETIPVSDGVEWAGPIPLPKEKNK